MPLPDQSALRAVIFDLDGTIIDSATDVLTCLTDTFNELSILPERALSRSCIGPPLHDMLRHLSPGITDSMLENAVHIFRRRYANSGFSASTVYPGVQELLEDLRQNKIDCYIATNKPRHLTDALLQLLNITAAFQDWQCIGDNGATTKTELIAALLRDHQLSASECLVVGDGLSDITAASALGISSIAHLGGYGDHAELLDCNPAYTVNDMCDVARILSPLISRQHISRDSIRA